MNMQAGIINTGTRHDTHLTHSFKQEWDPFHVPEVCVDGDFNLFLRARSSGYDGRQRTRPAGQGPGLRHAEREDMRQARLAHTRHSTHGD